MSDKRHYASESANGSESSHGFVNDTVVMVFSTKSTRDAYVRNSRNISTSAISRCEVTSKATNWSLTQNKNIAPRPFSGEFWGITEGIDDPTWCIGLVSVCSDTEERFYK